MAGFDSANDRTVVFTLAKGSQVTPDDFIPHLLCVSGRMEAFGTVGVGHVWHLTLDSPEAVDTIIDNGHFVVNDRSVSVSRLSSILTSATLFWLPYWVPHDHVVDCLESVLDDRVSCNYVRLPQHGFSSCYSTQRKIHSAVDLKKLPYFITISSEGRSYRSFLFVPGRPAMCFGCGQVGHMKNDCPDAPKNRHSFKRPSSPIQIVSSKKPSLDSETMISPAVSEQSSLTKACNMALVDGPLTIQFGSFEDRCVALSQQANQPPDPPKYRLIVKRKSGTVTITSKGAPIIVTPPHSSTVPRKQQKVESQSCSRENCCFISLWAKELICAEDMTAHLYRHHHDLIALDPV